MFMLLEWRDGFRQLTAFYKPKQRYDRVLNIVWSGPVAEVMSFFRGAWEAEALALARNANPIGFALGGPEMVAFPPVPD